MCKAAEIYCLLGGLNCLDKQFGRTETKEMIVAGCQFSIIPMDVDESIAQTLNCLEKAVHDHKADLVVFPETITTG